MTRRKPKRDKVGHRQVSGLTRQGGRAGSKRSHCACSGRWRRFREPNFPRSKARRFLATSDQLKISKQLCSHTTLQNGVHSDSKRANTAGRLACEARSQFQFSVLTPEVSQVSVARPNMAV